MKIGLYNIDSKIPNLALMKISAFHKTHGDSVAWYSPIEHDLFDKVYAASVFTWSNKSYVREGMVLGGTGFNISSVLPPGIESCDPDYSLYPDFKQALGFITRGCIRKCSFCFVPKKEGAIRPDRDVEQIARGRSELILLDNNFLAAGDYAFTQAEKIIRNRYKVDFNQGLDARLIDDTWASTLARLRWLKPLRMACDSDASLEPVIRAAERLRRAGCVPQRYFVYMLVTDIPSALYRATELKKHGLDPFAQPLRDTHGTPSTWEQKQFARWVNRKQYFCGPSWQEFLKIQTEGYKRA